jgi:hypothetical protein
MAEAKVVIDFPWEVAGPPVKRDSYSFPTPQGKAYITVAYFEDETNICILATPSGAGRFMRISPDTNFAMEERRSGEIPVAILPAVDEAWKKCIDHFAQANREIREMELGDSKDGGER